MKMFTALLAVLLLTGTAHAAPTNVVTPPSCYSDVESLSVYKVEVTHTKDMGGGVIKWTPTRGTVFLAEKNFWITASHVMDDGATTTGRIRVNEDKYIEAELIYFNKEEDIAVLYGPSGDLVPVDLQTTPVDQYEAVWTVGFPGLAGHNMAYFEGSALGISREGYVISNAMVLPGMSGGALFRCKGDDLEAVGTISSYTTERSSYKEFRGINIGPNGDSVEEEGTKTIIIVNANTGGSYSRPRLTAHLVKAMEQRVTDLDERQIEIKQTLEEIQNKINQIQ